MHAVSVGPWMLSVGVLAILLGLAAGNLAAGFLKKRGHGDAGPALWWLLVAAVVAARAAFVVRWWSGYRAMPWWAVFDIRDGGFMPWVGVGVLAVVGVGWLLRQPRLRRALPIALVSGLATWAAVTLAANRLQRAAHPSLPEVALQRLDGRSTTLAALKGKPMVINLWASWCPPCRRELPMLVAASHDMPNVQFVFVDQGEPASRVRDFLRRQHLGDAGVLLDDGNELARYYRAQGFPTTLFVDATGHLRDKRVGALSAASLRAHLQPMVSSRK